MAIIDRSGTSYGSWKILYKSGVTKCGFAYWMCECKCGKKENLISSQIQTGRARKDCGCSKSWAGKRFGNLVAISCLGRSNHNDYWLCKCDCGNENKVLGTALYQGSAKSCGCVREKKGIKRAENVVYENYIRKARERSFEFSLTRDSFLRITGSNCFYCNCSPNSKCIFNTKNKGQRVFIYNGIDRVNNNMGYIEGNCVPCCETCNRMKLDMEMYQWISKMREILANFDAKNSSECIIESVNNSNNGESHEEV